MTRKLNWASAILLVLGVGHLSLTLIMDHVRVADWLGDGLWATVPLVPDSTVEDLQTTTAFWAGWGSFSVPLILLALLIRHLARAEIAVPAWLGWGLVVWAVVGGLMLVPSPFIVAAVPGLLIVAAARDTRADRVPSSGGNAAAYGEALDTRIG